MDQSAFSLNNYKVKFHKTASELVIEAENSTTEKVYKYHATNESVKALNLFFLNDIDDLNEILTEGLANSNPNTKVSIGSGPSLELETIMKFGKVDKTNKISFKLEDQNIGAIAACERLINSLVEDGLKSANPIESQIIRVLQKLVDFGKNVEENMLHTPKNSEQRIENNNKGASDETTVRITEIEKNIKQLGSRIEELKNSEQKSEKLELRFEEINQKLKEHAVLTNANKSPKPTEDGETQTKLKELEKAIQEIEAKVQRHGSESNSQLQKLVGDFQKFESFGKTIESLQNIFSPEEKSGAPYPLVPLKEITHSESFIVSNYEVELFKTSKEFVIQAEELATSKIYMKTIGDNNVRGLTLNSYTNITNFYEGLATTLREKPDDSIITINEGKISFTKPKKFNLALEKIELEPFASCERVVRKFTEKTVEPRFVLENRLKEMFRKMFDQEKKLTNIVFETIVKFEQLEKSVEELQS